MNCFYYKEYQQLKFFLKDNFQVFFVLSLSTFSLVMQWYWPIGSSQALSHLFYYFVIPVLSILFVLRENPMNWGLKLGHFRVWISYVIITMLMGLPILIISSKFTSVNMYYSGQFDYYEFFISTVPTLFAWEYLLRGFLLFGLLRKFKEASIIVQMVPFVLLHLGKPEIETLSCILTGLWFGWVSYRGKSFWPAFIIHVFINFTARYFVNL